MSEWIGVKQNYLDYMGFVYKITNLNNERYYIGLKLFHHSNNKKIARKPTKVESARLEKYEIKNKSKHILYKKELRVKYKGLKKTVRGTKESDWKTYWGSCRELSEDIKNLGEDNFKREILHYCKTKFDCAYTELVEQLSHDVLFDKKAYNGIINVRLRKRK